MTRPFVPLLEVGLVVVAITLCGAAGAQQPPAAAPEPKLPPMPSMEGQQGDVSKPTTQIPPRKKPAATEKKTTEKETRPATVEKKIAGKAARPAPPHKKR